MWCEWVGCGIVDFVCERCIFDAGVVWLAGWWWALAGCNRAWMEATGSKTKQVREDCSQVVSIHDGDCG